MWQHESRRSVEGKKKNNVDFPSLLPTADCRTATLWRFTEKKGTPDRRLIASAQDMFGREPCSRIIGLAVTGEIF